MKSMKNLLITFLTVLSLGGAVYAQSDEEKKDSTKTAQTSEDNFSGNLELIKSTEPNNSYVRTNTFYGLPADISGYNWTEFYTDGSMMGRNTLSKNIAGPVGVKNMILYNSWSPVSTGIGASVDITPGNAFLQAYVTPVLIGSDGKIVENTSIAGIFGEANITDNVKLSGFGEINPSGKKGAEWSYGELNLEYMVNDNVSVSYNPALFNNGEGNLTPTIDHRATFKYTFK